MSKNQVEQIGDITYESVSHEKIIKRLERISSVAITNIHEHSKQPELLSQYRKKIHLTNSTPQGISGSGCVGNVGIDIMDVKDLGPLYKKFLRKINLKSKESDEIKGDLVNFIEKELGFVTYKKRRLEDCYANCYDGLRMVRIPSLSYLEKVGTIKTIIDLSKGHENLSGKLDSFSYHGHLVKRTIINFPGLRIK